MSRQAVCPAALGSPCICQACPAPLCLLLFGVLGQSVYMSGLAVSSQVISTLIAALSGLCTSQVQPCVRRKVEQHLHSGLQQFFHHSVVHHFSAMSAHLIPKCWPPLVLQGGPRGEPRVEQRCRLCMSRKPLAFAAVHCLHADVSASRVVRLLSSASGACALLMPRIDHAPEC